MFILVYVIQTCYRCKNPYTFWRQLKLSTLFQIFKTPGNILCTKASLQNKITKYFCWKGKKTHFLLMMFFKLIKIILKSKHYNIASRTTKQNHQAKKLEKAIVLSSKKKTQSKSTAWYLRKYLYIFWIFWLQGFVKISTFVLRHIHKYTPLIPNRNIFFLW